MKEHTEHTGNRLYAMVPSRENMARAASVRFQRMTPGYILVYDSKPPGGEAVEVTKEELSRLNRHDQAWLYDCMKLLLREKLEKNEGETRKRLHEMVERLEQELAAEAEKEKGGTP